MSKKNIIIVILAMFVFISITKGGTYLLQKSKNNKIINSMIVLMNIGVKQSVSLMNEEQKSTGTRTPSQVDSKKFIQIQSNHEMVVNDLMRCKTSQLDYTSRYEFMLNISSKYFTLLALATVTSDDQIQRKQDFNSALADFNIAISQYNSQYTFSR